MAVLAASVFFPGFSALVFGRLRSKEPDSAGHGRSSVRLEISRPRRSPRWNAVRNLVRQVRTRAGQETQGCGRSDMASTADKTVTFVETAACS